MHARLYASAREKPLDVLSLGAQYLRSVSSEIGVAAECMRGLPELRDMARLHQRTQARHYARHVTTIALEEV